MATKKFPKWAPAVLVHLHAVRQENPLPDTSITLEEAFVRTGYPAAQAKARAATANAKELFLPEGEKNALLEKLLIDGRMESVWRTLGRRIVGNNEYHRLLTDIEFAITGWRRDLQLSPVERRKFFVRVHDAAMELRDLLNSAPRYGFTTLMEPQRLITDDALRGYLEETLGIDLAQLPQDPYIKNGDDFVNYAHFWLHEVVPALEIVLLNIAVVASENIGKPPLAKKPKAKKAAEHYFIRSLSASMRRRYGQPLHDTVAAITCVVFDDDAVDSDLVRKLNQDTPGRFEADLPRIPPGNFPLKLGKKPSSKRPR
jgi:hypothetical protein